MPGEPAASCSGLVKIYKTATGEVHALKGVDAVFPAAAVSAVVGPSGSGKSSLLRLLAGLDRPSAGQVQVGGVRLSGLSLTGLRRVRRRLLGYVFQRPADNLISYLSVAEHLQLAARLRGVRDADGRELLELLGLADRRHHLPHQLSGGEQQRLAFARAAVGDPPVVVADEPTAEQVALDRRLRRIPTERDPSAPERRMPTQLGNTLRSAETWPIDKYGLDPVKCWPRLWLLLPEPVRRELADARASLDAAGAAVLWGALFVAWTAWAWWAAPIGLATALIAYRRAVQTAEGYGDLVESAFDLHRSALYASLRWPLPPSPAEEREAGNALTEYLWRGSDKPSPEFVTPENDADRGGSTWSTG